MISNEKNVEKTHDLIKRVMKKNEKEARNHQSILALGKLVTGEV